jgi:hypothetical protein
MSLGQKQNLLGRLACRFCHHDLYEHNLIVGCPHCHCAGTPSEGSPRTDEELDRKLIPAGQYAAGYEPEPPAESTWDAKPDLQPDYDEDGSPIPGTLSAGWDISWGCRINFGPGPDGDLRVDVHVSDKAQKDGVAQLPTTPDDLRALANHLYRIAADQEIHKDGAAHTWAP